MAYSMMFIALGATTEAEVRETFGQLRLGTLQKVDRAEITEGPKAGMVKFFLHYSVMTADSLRAQLDDFETRKKEGEVNVRPKRVVYGVKKNGDEMYWQIYKCATPAEREKAKPAEFKPRVE
jgi:hypothetical protein